MKISSRKQAGGAGWNLQTALGDTFSCTQGWSKHRPAKPWEWPSNGGPGPDKWARCCPCNTIDYKMSGGSASSECLGPGPESYLYGRSARPFSGRAPGGQLASFAPPKLPEKPSTALSMSMYLRKTAFACSSVTLAMPLSMASTSAVLSPVNNSNCHRPSTPLS